jgi:hypothetical protein
VRTDVAAFDDPRFEPERLRAAACAVLEEIVHVRDDKELVKVWNERFEPWLTRENRRSRPLGVPGGWGARVELRGIEVVTIRTRLQAIEILALVAQPCPALFIELAAVIQGNDGTQDHKLCWKLELDDALAQHWRLVDAYARPELRALRGG